MPLDQKVKEMVQAYFAGHTCGELDYAPTASTSRRPGCGCQAQRVYYGKFWCHDCWRQEYDPPPPVECRTSGDPNLGWSKR